MITQTPKGFRDYLSADSIKRSFVLSKITRVFQKFGFDPLETPTLEYAEVLKGKYGEEERLIYSFKTKGGDELALKYDQTVPLARVIAEYGPSGSQKLPIPFKRYQIQSAYRGENPQKGRYREFLQCDADIVGSSSSASDAEILALIYEVYKNLGLNVVIKLNDRTLISSIEPRFLSAIDKLKKIGPQGVLDELKNKGLSDEKAGNLLAQVRDLQPTTRIINTINIYEGMGYPKDSLEFDSTMVRGLDYYTGIIVEVVLKSEPNSSSLGGGGRWDSMIGKFTEIDQPAVGFSVGLERTIEAMEEAGVLNTPNTQTKVLVTIFSPDLLDTSLDVCSKLRSNNINTEFYLEPDTKLDKQLKYADQKGIPFAIIIGPDEVKNKTYTLKDLKKQTQKTLSLEALLKKLS